MSNEEQNQSAEEFRTECELTHPDEPTTTVITAVAALVGKAPGDLDLLGETIDTEALNRLFTARARNRCMDGHVSFQFESRTVMVRSTGEIIIQAPDGEHTDDA